MSARPAVAFRIDRVTAEIFVPVLIDATGYEMFRHTGSRCADAAAYVATRGGTRHLEYRGMTTMRQGVDVAIDTDHSCSVTPNVWPWEHHGHTHGTLRKIIDTTNERRKENAP